MERSGLFRSRTDKVIGGVAGGIARSLNADPAIVRLIFAILVIFGGGGLLLYLILWIAIPEEPFEFLKGTMPSGTPGAGPESQAQSEPQSQSASEPFKPPYYPPRRNNGALIVGLVLILVGLVFLGRHIFPGFYISFHTFWPVIIVIAGLALIFSSFTGTNKSHNP
jgi:phage shock protein C